MFRKSVSPQSPYIKGNPIYNGTLGNTLGTLWAMKKSNTEHWTHTLKGCECSIVFLIFDEAYL